MCNRPIKDYDISVMKGEAWYLKEFKLVGPLRSGMTLYPADYYLKKETKNKEV